MALCICLSVNILVIILNSETACRCMNYNCNKNCSPSGTLQIRLSRIDYQPPGKEKKTNTGQKQNLKAMRYHHNLHAR